MRSNLLIEHWPASHVDWRLHQSRNKVSEKKSFPAIHLWGTLRLDIQQRAASFIQSLSRNWAKTIVWDTPRRIALTYAMLLLTKYSQNNPTWRPIQDTIRWLWPKASACVCVCVAQDCQHIIIIIMKSSNSCERKQVFCYTSKYRTHCF